MPRDTEIDSVVRGVAAAPAVQPSPVETPQFGDRYEIEKEIGRGGMGRVFLARDRRLGRKVAIKVLATGTHSESALLRLEQEARAAALLEHPNIVVIHDIGNAGGTPYIVSELLHGCTLRERLSKPISTTEAISLAAQIASGLSAAHDHGIIHRDLKPENLFVTDEGRLKILDFGVAKLILAPEDTVEGSPPPKTETGAVIGTVGYMSPEQVRGEAVDGRSDLFSLGAILYELLSGHQPFARGNRLETNYAIVHAEPEALPSHAPPALDAIVRRCLRKNRDERFQSAQELAEALAQVPVGSGLKARTLIGELKRRRVFRALVGYGIAAFAVLQIIEPVMHGLHWPDDLFSYVVVALAVGFPIVVSLAWIFDVKAGRIERMAAAPAGPRGARLGMMLVGIGLLAAAPGVIWFFVVRGAAKPALGAAATTASIAVLPFADMSAGKDQEYFSDGIAEEILNALAKVEGLSITGRTSSFAFKGKSEDLRSIGQQLGVSAVLEGSVRKSGNRVRVTAQVVKTADGFHLWSETYDRDLSDIFAVQSEIARAVGQALKVKLLPAKREKRPESMDAYSQVLLAKSMWKSEVDQAAIIPVFERAIALDPRYAPAWSGLAGVLVFYKSPAESAETSSARIRRALVAAEKAMTLDPELAEAYAVRGLIRTWYFWDWAGAKTDLERSLSLAPGNAVFARWYGQLLGILGRSADALRLQIRATELDPLWSPNWSWLGGTYVYQEEYALARNAFQRGMDLVGSKQTKGALALSFAYSYLLEGQLDRASEWLARLIDDNARLAMTAAIEHSRGHPQEAKAALDAFIARAGSTLPFWIAQEYAWFGDPDRAFEWLDKAYTAHDFLLTEIKLQPSLKSLRGDPRYTALLKKMNLPLD